MPVVVGTTPPVGPPPVVTPPDVVPANQGQPSMTWTGWTGESWTLAGDFSALVLLEADGRGGMIMPPVENLAYQSATADGATWAGYNIPPRDVTWPLIFVAGSPVEMRAEHARFLNTLRPGTVGTLTVALPDGERRSLALRYVSGAEGDFGTNTYGASWLRHAVTMRAYDPFFFGDSVSQIFSYSPGVNFYGGVPGGLGPPFYVSSSDTIDSATITNPGDADVYGKWKIYGPFTSATVGFGSSTISLPITKTLGHWIEVDTNPLVGTIIDDLGANLWQYAGAVNFAPLPAASTTSLSVTIIGSGTGTAVDFSFTPKFWRAW